MRVVTDAAKANTDFEIEQLVRLTVLEALYTQRRVNPNNPGIFDLDLEGLTGQSRDHLEFTFWYLISKNLVKRGDSSRLLITADGVDYLEQHYETNLQRKRLKEALRRSVHRTLCDGRSVPSLEPHAFGLEDRSIPSRGGTPQSLPSSRYTRSVSRDRCHGSTSRCNLVGVSSPVVFSSHRPRSRHSAAVRRVSTRRSPDHAPRPISS